MVRFPTTKVPKRRLTGTRAALSVIWGAGSLRRGVGGTPFGSPLVLRYTHRRPDHRRKTRHQVALVLVAEPDHPLFEGAPEAKQATERRLGLQIATRLLNGLRKVAALSRLEPSFKSRAQNAITRQPLRRGKVRLPVRRQGKAFALSRRMVMASRSWGAGGPAGCRFPTTGGGADPDRVLKWRPEEYD